MSRHDDVRNSPEGLREERVWREKRYRNQVTRVISLLESLEREIVEAVTREIVYDQGVLREHTHVDQADRIVNAVLQAVSNMDLGGLARDAGELTSVIERLSSLEEIAERFPEVAKTWATDYDDMQQARQEEQDERETRARNRCEVSVPEGGRSVGFRRCQRKGSRRWTDESGKERKVCPQHLKGLEARGESLGYWHKDEPRRLDTRTKGQS